MGSLMSSESNNSNNKNNPNTNNVNGNENDNDKNDKNKKNITGYENYTNILMENEAREREDRAFSLVEQLIGGIESKRFQLAVISESKWISHKLYKTENNQDEKTAFDKKEKEKENTQKNVEKQNTNEKQNVEKVKENKENTNNKKEKKECLMLAFQVVHNEKEDYEMLCELMTELDKVDGVFLSNFDEPEMIDTQPSAEQQRKIKRKTRIDELVNELKKLNVRVQIINDEPEINNQSLKGETSLLEAHSEMRYDYSKSRIYLIADLQHTVLLRELYKCSIFDLL